ncbi:MULTISPECIES: CU044_2847 family protein [Streptomyces]|uniref:CU044_2847 family protein n=1 Tax=Streptomyces TaxID=1883 RepID=UPI0023B89F93|nr:CU044_2847 family protein [Streptomyces sp. 5-6(2022)]
MTDYAEFPLPDGTPVRLELTPVATASAPAPPNGSGEGGKGPAMPGGIGGVTPVGRAPRGAAALAVEGLQAVLRPLGPLLQEVHNAVSAAPNPPDEIQVQFGVQVGQDLKLGIVGANGQASMTISATWQLSGSRTA